MSKKAAEHHRKASMHSGEAAKHHDQAAKQHEAGQHEKAALGGRRVSKRLGVWCREGPSQARWAFSPGASCRGRHC